MLAKTSRLTSTLQWLVWKNPKQLLNGTPTPIHLRPLGGSRYVCIVAFFMVVGKFTSQGLVANWATKKKKNTALLSMKYRLFGRDPYNGLTSSPQILIVYIITFIPQTSPNNQGFSRFFSCHYCHWPSHLAPPKTPQQKLRSQRRAQFNPVKKMEWNTVTPIEVGVKSSHPSECHVNPMYFRPFE